MVDPTDYKDYPEAQDPVGNKFASPHPEKESYETHLERQESFLRSQGVHQSNPEKIKEGAWKEWRDTGSWEDVNQYVNSGRHPNPGSKYYPKGD